MGGGGGGGGGGGEERLVIVVADPIVLLLCKGFESSVRLVSELIWTWTPGRSGHLCTGWTEAGEKGSGRGEVPSVL